MTTKTISYQEVVELVMALPEDRLVSVYDLAHVERGVSITQCPTCGSDQVKQVCRDWSSTYQGQSHVVPALTFYECPVCGERVFECDAVAKIRVYSPAYAAKPVTTRSAKVSQADSSTQAVSMA